MYDAALADQAKKLSAAADAAAKLPKQKTLSSLFPAATKDMKDRAHLKFIIECGLPKGPSFTVRTVHLPFRSLTNTRTLC